MVDNEMFYLSLFIVLLFLIYIWYSDSKEYYIDESEYFDTSKENKEMLELTKDEIRTLKNMAKDYSNGKMKLSNLRITGDLIVDGMIRCKHNLLARELNAINISGNVVDGATVKGEIVKDNDNILVKRGQRIRITNGLGEYQAWTIENDK